ncbi:MAG: histidine kinase [Flavobacteriaceae bacterium]|nr:histidine kinase [Flavobacteriaceae bacterium]
MFSEALKIIETIFQNKSLCFKESLDEICKTLKEKIIHFDWVGFYFADHKRKELFLYSFAGNETEHKKIPFGKGICGQVALSNKSFNVPDVEKEKNYISCNVNVKSELVVPIFLEGQNIGQIDVDSKSLNPFNNDDVRLLESVCNLIAKKMITNKIKIHEPN